MSIVPESGHHFLEKRMQNKNKHRPRKWAPVSGAARSNREKPGQSQHPASLRAERSNPVFVLARSQQDSGLPLSFAFRNDGCTDFSGLQSDRGKFDQIQCSNPLLHAASWRKT
jgi:hypothetical protein